MTAILAPEPRTIPACCSDPADYLRRWRAAETAKQALRARYAGSALREKKSDFDVWKLRSEAFWAEYEDINRRMLPEDPVYSGSRAGVTLATTTDLWTLSCGASGQLRILESFIGGEATTSTVCRVAVQRSTGGTTPTNQTPEKFSTRSPAAVATFATTWSAQPSLSGAAALFHAFNAFGGGDRWVSQPGQEIYLVNAEILSARSASGIPVVSAHVVWEEM